MSEAQINSRNFVGPVIQAGEVADALIEAVRDDNPGKEVHVRVRASYVRIEVEDECLLRRATVEARLGRPFQMSELELVMPAFAGQIETDDNLFRFYFDRKL